MRQFCISYYYVYLEKPVHEAQVFNKYIILYYNMFQFVTLKLTERSTEVNEENNNIASMLILLQKFRGISYLSPEE